MILAIFDPPYPHVRARKISQTPPPYSYVIFHFRLEGKKRIRMSCFLLELQIMNSVKYNFIMLKN